MRRLLPLLVVSLAVAVSGCSGPSAPVELLKNDHFTQGGVSMEPTVKAGQVISVAPVAKTYTATRGDIVVFHAPSDKWGPDTTLPYLKRVIAVGGETISCCDVQGRVYVNGTGLDEPYVAHNSPLDTPPGPGNCASRRFDAVKVPEGSIFVRRILGVVATLEGSRNCDGRQRSAGTGAADGQA
jgi:signal peptidase I